jgi:SRSO17 transposase
VVADSFYGEDRTFRHGLEQLGVGYVLALKPSFAWWHRVGDIGSPQAAAQAAACARSEQPGDWVSIERTFHDGHAEQWWAFEVVAGPFGPDHALRNIVVTTDPATLPDLTTWYLIANLPAPGSPWALKSVLPAATLAELVRLYGLRNWVEQSYKQVKHTLGWAHYQVRSDTAIRRHWTLVCCAFTFCWWRVAVSHLADGLPPQKKPSTRSRAPLVLAPRAATGARLARPLHHAQSLLERLFAIAPATPLATPA